jgi:mannose-6-phosphate isomerase-like protein (cupin superfamily)
VVRKYTSQDAALTAEYGIRIGRWTQYQDLGKLPFDAMWCVIPPGGSSQEDHHPEIEFAVVVDGHASYRSAGEDVDAPAGSVILLSPEERHVIHNRSQDQPLTILSIYWLPDAAPAGTDAAPVATDAALAGTDGAPARSADGGRDDR